MYQPLGSEGLTEAKTFLREISCMLETSAWFMTEIEHLWANIKLLATYTIFAIFYHTAFKNYSSSQLNSKIFYGLHFYLFMFQGNKLIQEVHFQSPFIHIATPEDFTLTDGMLFSLKKNLMSWCKRISQVFVT
jgi:hypothetical protein